MKFKKTNLKEGQHYQINGWVGVTFMCMCGDGGGGGDLRKVFLIQTNTIENVSNNRPLLPNAASIVLFCFFFCNDPEKQIKAVV